MRKIETAIFSVALGFLLIGCAGSHRHLKVGQTQDGEVVEAEGLAPYNAKDLVQTKRASLSDAQRNAVEKAVGVFVSAQTRVEKAVAIENNILSRTEGYVKKYEILKEWTEKDFYKTKIRALVAIKDLEADLKELSLLPNPELKKIRVKVDLQEFIDNESVEEGAAKASLEKILLDRGFTVVSSSGSQESDIVVTGKASSFPFQSDGLGGFVSYRA